MAEHEEETVTTNGNGERTPVTRRDLMEENIDKVFPHGPSEIPPRETSLEMIASRPVFSAILPELEAAKTMAMAGPLIPEFCRGHAGICWGFIQLSKRWSKYDGRTNSWVSFDPIAIASCAYLVEGQGGKLSVGYTSQFVGAIIDAFVPLSARMRYRYEGEGQARRCTAYATRKGDEEAFEYTSPPLSEITPKKSPLWQSDPDRQLAYYSRRAWARLFAPSVLLGVYDVDELEGQADQRARKVKDLADVEGLQRRLRGALPPEGHSEGFRQGVVEDGLAERQPEPKPARKAPRARTEAATDRAREKRATQARAEPKKPASGHAKGKAKASPAPKKANMAAEAMRDAPPPKPPAAPAEPPTPRSPEEYVAYVIGWLPTIGTEEAIEERWRGERRMRNQAGVTEEVRNEVRVEVDRRIDQLRQANRP